MNCKILGSTERANMCIEMLALTDTGRIRKHNEDYISIDKSLGLAVLADGMGGYQAGEVASKTAIKVIIEQLNSLIKTQYYKHSHRKKSNYHISTVFLEQAVLKANQIIYEMAETQACYKGMGTTVIAVLFHNDFISIAHVGDSRLYRLRNHELCQITKDHSVNQELIDCGYYTLEQARCSTNKNLVTRALGVSQKLSVEIQEYDSLAQDMYLLCSDGLSDMLEDHDIQNIMSYSNSFKQTAQSLVNQANQNGGKDNISLILVRPCQILEMSKVAWWKNPFKLFNYNYMPYSRKIKSKWG
ncbi:MAG: Stp1/IreP family PP2C-type Ser/Thr phosphatase, partial [Thiomargarita sp.]|nr:Stp1/IreP family PP2C-type Ser/Thr phosphatase [Thiomargarita sp.]